MWEVVQRWFDDKIKNLGVQNAYFPLFITEDVLNTEKDHVEGFAPEVAWVTKYGNSEMEKPIAIRPTSETVSSRERTAADLVLSEEAMRAGHAEAFKLCTGKQAQTPRVLRASCDGAVLAGRRCCSLSSTAARYQCWTWRGATQHLGQHLQVDC